VKKREMSGTTKKIASQPMPGRRRR